MKRYAVTLNDGSVAITTVAIGTIEELMTRIVWPDGKTAVSWKEVSLSDIPTDRTFRDAWKQREDGKVEIDMPKARSIQMAKIRYKRNQLLDETDKEWLKASSRKDTVKLDQVEKEKQRLRDVPQNLQSKVDSCSTPEELKAIDVS